MKKFVVTLTDEEREELRRMLASGKGAARKLIHARILLKANSSKAGPGWDDARIAEAQARKIVLVMDNLNTHSPASLYEAFAPAEAKRIADKLEIHYTPKHGSWLDMAEIELGILSRQCLDRRIENVEYLRTEVAAWEQQRNLAKAKVNWQFTTADARIKLRRLYPSI